MRVIQVHDEEIMYRARIVYTYEDGHVAQDCYGPYGSTGPATQVKNKQLADAQYRKERWSASYSDAYWDRTTGQRVESKLTSIQGFVDSGKVVWDATG